MAKDSNKKWWFIGCGCLLFLCLFVTAVGGIIGVVWYSSQQGGRSLFYINGPEAEVKAVVTDQAAAIKAGDFERAYADFMSEKYKVEVDGPGFEKTVEANTTPLLRYQTLTIERVNMGKDTATVVADVVGQDGSKVRIDYVLTRDAGGSWKIDGFQRTDFQPSP